MDTEIKVGSTVCLKADNRTHQQIKCTVNKIDEDNVELIYNNGKGALTKITVNINTIELCEPAMQTIFYVPEKGSTEDNP